jgi:hypothetical protein
VIEPPVAKIAQALDECQADTVKKVDCRKFIPSRFRKTAAPSPELMYSFDRPNGKRHVESVRVIDVETNRQEV